MFVIVADQGWLGISNGQLLSLAAAEFVAFVTVDRNSTVPATPTEIRHCCNSRAAGGKSNRIDDLVLLVPDLVSANPESQEGRRHFDRPLTIGSSDRGGCMFGEPRRESMTGINQLRFSAKQPRVAQPHR